MKKINIDREYSVLPHTSNAEENAATIVTNQKKAKKEAAKIMTTLKPTKK